MKSDLDKCKFKALTYKERDQRILSCLTTSFAANLCRYSGHQKIGYIDMNTEKVLSLFPTSSLSIISKHPDWILAYEYFQNK